MISVGEIRDRYLLRSQSMSKSLAEMRDLTEAYEGTVSVPLPELDRNEKTAVANLIAQGLDQSAMRIASSLPDVWFPAVTPGQDLAERRARKSRQAVLGWWDQSELDLKLARRARWLIGYACAPATVRWDPVAEVPRWHLRSPLSTFPASGDDPDDMVPSDCIFCYKRSRRWLNDRYPQAMARLAKNDDVDAAFEVMEYVDDAELVLCVAANAPTGDRNASYQGAPLVELERVANRAGMPLVAIPGRMSLRRRQGAYQGMIGLYQQQAKLMALEVIAVTRGVFPDQWLVARPNENPQIVSIADGMRGMPGVVRGGQLETVNVQPGYQTAQTIDRIERYERLTGGIPAEFGGESTTNVRTGRRGDSILSAVVDFPVAEAQKILARAHQHEVKMAIALAKAYAGDTPKTFFVNAKGAKGAVSYVANRDIPTDACVVSFAHAGSDENALVVGIGQRLGVGTLSVLSAMRLDPLNDDPDFEVEQIRVEALEKALLGGIAQQVASGGLGPADVARIKKALVEDNLSLEDAVLQVQQQKQVEQATAGAPGSPAGPVPPGAPAAQPGLAGPGAPPQAGVGQIAPTPNEQGLAQLLGALKGGNANPAGVR